MAKLPPSTKFKNSEISLKQAIGSYFGPMKGEPFMRSETLQFPQEISGTGHLELHGHRQVMQMKVLKDMVTLVLSLGIQSYSQVDDWGVQSPPQHSIRVPLPFSGGDWIPWVVKKVNSIYTLRKLRWNLNIQVWKMMFLFQGGDFWGLGGVAFLTRRMTAGSSVVFKASYLYSTRDVCFWWFSLVVWFSPTAFTERQCHPDVLAENWFQSTSWNAKKSENKHIPGDSKWPFHPQTLEVT